MAHFLYKFLNIYFADFKKLCKKNGSHLTLLCQILTLSEERWTIFIWIFVFEIFFTVVGDNINAIKTTGRSCSSYKLLCKQKEISLFYIVMCLCWLKAWKQTQVKIKKCLFCLEIYDDVCIVYIDTHNIFRCLKNVYNRTSMWRAWF